MKSYYEIKQEYKSLFKKHPDTINLYNEEGRKDIILKTTQYELTPEGIETKEETEQVNFINYYNVVSPDTVRFFRNLGGKEQVTCKAVPKYGYIPIRVESTSPDRKYKTVREFTF